MKIKKLFLIFAALSCHLSCIFTMQQEDGAGPAIRSVGSLESLAARAVIRHGIPTPDATTPHAIRDIITRERDRLNAIIAAHGNNPSTALLAHLQIIANQPHLIDHELIKDLIACEIKRNAHQPIETTLQRLAEEGNNKPLINILLDHGANIEARDNKGYTPLHYAASNGHQATVALLLDRSAAIEARNNDGSTPLHWAHQATVALLLNRGANIEAQDNHGYTPLHYTAYRGHQATVALLLDRGAAIDARDNQGYTALQLAAFNGQQAIVTFLLDRGANIEARNNTRNNKGYTPLHYAASNGHQATVALLLDRGANIEAQDNYRSTALHLAVSNGHQATVAFLLDRGANIEAQDHYECTPLFYAISEGNPDAAKLLLQHGAQFTPLILLWETIHLIKSHPIATGSIVAGGALVGFCIFKYLMRK